ncbi:SDR family NAD(P)-dependent oxidoreductase [Streptomyces sp. TRM70350]|uniref:SDR family NAD(P)-dependent oxidoreductase n=1 Tax=Streptomyces sp. TRM70350 TaxID=2856165 RepID=UPI001C48E970|nr:glucose 1-dehydrogenase [Streptomyces sp. TRM70350]MBV7698645.1 glucose 1-dehydrogenase [Streptomyces sp. TRM70350]
MAGLKDVPARLTGKVAVVTGASKGIGAAIAVRLAAEGAAVAVNHSSDRPDSKQAADRVIESIRSSGGVARAVRADVTDASRIALFEETVRLLGPPDVLVNNAGIYSFTPVENLSEEEARRHFDTNVLGPVLLTQAALRYFPCRGGTVINIGSIWGQSGTPRTCAYSASKAAVEALTRVLAAELGPRGIRVNCVAPGFTETEGTHALGLPGTRLHDRLLTDTPLGRGGHPEDIVPVVAFLASDEAAWITGETIRCSGGLR